MPTMKTVALPGPLLRDLTVIERIVLMFFFNHPFEVDYNPFIFLDIYQPTTFHFVPSSEDSHLSTR